jgi:REP element-mobilizing transposase RayT
MVIAAHLVFTCYGFWLPNDPRGSWSDFVRSWDLLQFGPATKTDQRRSLARDPHDRERRQAAKQALLYDPIQLTGIQALHVARGIAQAVAESGYQVYACAILPDHVHAVVARHRNRFERVIGHFKARATQELLGAGLHPFANERDACGRVPSIWVHRAWKVFLEDDEGIARAIDYARRNLTRAGLPAQSWSFVQAQSR